MNKTNKTITLPYDIAKALAERARQDLEYAAEQHADCVSKAHISRKNAEAATNGSEYADLCLKDADNYDAQAAYWDAQFKTLERICVAVTKAGA